MRVRGRLAGVFGVMIGTVMLIGGGVGPVLAQTPDPTLVGMRGAVLDAEGVGGMGFETHISADLGSGPLQAVVTVGGTQDAAVTFTGFSGGYTGEVCTILNAYSAQCTLPVTAGNDYLFGASIALSQSFDWNQPPIMWAWVAVTGADGSQVADVTAEWPFRISDASPPSTTEATTTVPEATTTTVAETTTSATVAPTTLAATTIAATTASTLPNTGSREHLVRTGFVGLGLVLLGLLLLTGAAAVGRYRDEN